MNAWQSMVRDFHRKFNLTEGDDPYIREPGLRMDLIDEEAGEIDRALMDNDIEKAADGLADLIYVCLGAAVAWGIDLDPIFAEVHRTNMAKEGGPKRGDGKLLKPPGWQPPDIARLLREQGWTG